MPESLSLIDLMLEATVVVQLVMLSLVVASGVSWVLIFQRGAILRNVTAAVDEFEDRFWSGADLRSLYDELQSQAAEGDDLSGIEGVFCAGFKEFTRLREQSGMDAAAVMQGAQRAMRVAVAREEEFLEKGLPFLATVGSTSPYVGLFGTVWGIMNSFRNLATVSQASLATVAPGISEALIATAMGLFAAIPAVIAYNRFSARVDALMGRYDNFADEFTSILHRAVHGGS